MNRFADIHSGIVGVVVEQDDTPQIPGQWVACAFNVGPGWTYDGATFTAPVPVPEPRIVTKVAMITRFTDPEFVSILTAAKTDTDVEAWKTRFDVATSIDLDSDRTKAGFDMLVTKTLLSQERATEILTNPVQPNER